AAVNRTLGPATQAAWRAALWPGVQRMHLDNLRRPGSVRNEVGDWAVYIAADVFNLPLLLATPHVPGYFAAIGPAPGPGTGEQIGVVLTNAHFQPAVFTRPEAIAEIVQGLNLTVHTFDDTAAPLDANLGRAWVRESQARMLGPLLNTYTTALAG